MSAERIEQAQLTNNGAANWAPFVPTRTIGRSYFRPICTTRPAELLPLHRQCRRNRSRAVTYDARFDSFPIFSRDGKKLVSLPQEMPRSLESSTSLSPIGFHRNSIHRNWIPLPPCMLRCDYDVGWVER